jgi:tetratricopeptide (TPR) repeat protein
MSQVERGSRNSSDFTEAKERRGAGGEPWFPSTDSWKIEYSEEIKEPGSHPTLCLNMIVKNESRIIKRLLESVAPWIDSYCICDTGSTDNTIEIIETFFKNINIPGTIIQEPFRDFGYNRTFALKACHQIKNADYILLLDADMVFWANPELPKDEFKRKLLTADAHYIFQGTEQFYYKNTRIVRNRFGISYWGVTHEYVNTPPNTIYNLLQKSDVFIKDIGDGGAKADKFVRDIRLLKKGLETDPNSDRYHFYLANSYKDNGDYDNAIETYKRRIEIGGWHEEIWYSYYNIGMCYKYKGDMGKAIHAWMDAYQFFPDRIENLYEIVHYYRCCGKNRLAYPFWVLANNELKKPKRDFLFMQKDVYDYKMDYEMSILGYYCNTDNYNLARISMDVIKYPHLDDGVYRNVISNYKFYAKPVCDWKTDSQRAFISAVSNIGEKIMSAATPEFVTSTPSIFKISESEIYVNVRYVNYRIGEKGEYINGTVTETRNILATVELQEDGSWKITNEVLMEHDRSEDNRYVGIEDVRLFSLCAPGDYQNIFDGSLEYNGNRGAKNGDMVVEIGRVDVSTGATPEKAIYMKIDGQHKIEKNWVYFKGRTATDKTNINSDRRGKKMIYGWSPLTIGDVSDDGRFTITHKLETPYFFKNVRGSTNGVVIGDEIWFLCHLVSYEDRRYYYHLFVVLDADTYQVKKYTEMFTLEREKVEYSLGFTVMGDDFLIGYSLMDKCTKYVTIPKLRFDSIMI